MGTRSLLLPVLAAGLACGLLPAPPAMAQDGGASVFLAPPVPLGETQIGNCRMGFGEVYRCTFEGLPPKDGYQSATRVADLFGEAPTLDLDAVSGAEADVWALLDGTWRFMGRWGKATAFGAECLAPVAGQTAEARANLGQDAWMLCLI